MKLKFLVLILSLCLLFFPLVSSSPEVSFSYSSVENKTSLTPVLNSDVNEYRWIIYGKNNSYYSSTEWIDSTVSRPHVSILNDGKFIVTIEGKNSTSGEIDTFTNEINVRVINESRIEEEEEEEQESIYEIIGSKIINMLPEPIKSFLIQIGTFGVAVIIFGLLFLLAFVTRRKKTKQYVRLEKYEQE